MAAAVPAEAMMMMLMSRTVRYFKLMYIVAGILMSNEAICETVDQIKIAPRVVPEMKEMLQPKRVYRTVGNASTNWLRRVYLYGLGKIKRRLARVSQIFSTRALIAYLLDSTTNYISRKFVLGSDCDMIYSK